MQEIHLGLGLKRKEESDIIPFKGEVIASPELLGTAIASQIGLTAGTVQNDDAGWLAYDFEGKTLLVAKRSLRHTVSWDQIHVVNAVYGGRTIVLNGEVFKIRLLKGSVTDPAEGSSGDDVTSSWGSEWNRLMYPLIPNPNNQPASGISGEGLVFGSWANYTEEELTTGPISVPGSYNWCQEIVGSNVSNRVIRGAQGVIHLSTGSPSTSNHVQAFGWRPVLELVRTTEQPQDIFLGEVPVTKLITGDALASQIGLTAGVAQHSAEPWLQFLTKEGQILYVAKKPFRYRVSWNHILAVNAVYGERIITVGDKRFKVRLLKGAASDPISWANGHDHEHSWGSEWNRLMYPLVPNPTNTPTRPISREGIRYGTWANYTESHLGIASGNGRYSWCQEQESSGYSRVLRGYVGLSYFYLSNPSDTPSDFGWRPVLELVP